MGQKRVNLSYNVVMINRKKVLYIITKSVWGGAQRYVYDLAINLPRDKFEPIVAAGGSGPLFNKLKEANIRTIVIPGLERDINIVKELKSFWHLVKILFAEKPEIVHLNSSKTGCIGAIAVFIYKIILWRNKPITVFTVHGWSFLEPRPRWQNKIIYLISRISSVFQDKIILICTKDYKIAQEFIPLHKLSLIFNGIERGDYIDRRIGRETLSKKIKNNLQPDQIVIGTVAELTKNKGLQYLVYAIHMIQNQHPRINFCAVIIGDGEDYSRLENQINSRGLRKKIFLAGFIPDANRYITAFDIFVLPSLKEGLPYTIMEAMNGLTPVVASDVGGIPDLINHDKNGILVSPSDPKELSQALIQLIENKEKRMSIQKEAIKTLEAKFTLDTMLAKTINLYDSQ